MTRNKERMVALDKIYTIEISYPHPNLGNHPDGGSQQVNRVWMEGQL